MKMVIKGASAPKNEKKPKNPTSSSTIGTMVGQKAIQATIPMPDKLTSISTKNGDKNFKRLPAVVHNVQYAGLLQAPKNFNAGLSGMSGRVPAASSTSDENNLLSGGRSKEMALLPLSMDQSDLAGKGMSQNAFKTGLEGKTGEENVQKLISKQRSAAEPPKLTLKEQREAALMRFYQTLTNQPKLTKQESLNLRNRFLPKDPYAKATARTGSTSNAYLHGRGNVRQGRLAGTTYQSQVGLADDNEMMGFQSATQGLRDNPPLQHFSSLGLRAKGHGPSGDHMYAANSLLQGFKQEQNVARGIQSSTGARPQKLIDLASLNVTQQKVTAFGAPHRNSASADEDATAALKSAIEETHDEHAEKQDHQQVDQDGPGQAPRHQESLAPFEGNSAHHGDTQASQMAAQQIGDSMSRDPSKNGGLPDQQRASHLISPGAVTDDVSQLERARESQQHAFENDVSTVKYETKAHDHPNSTMRKLDSQQDANVTSPKQLELDSVANSNNALENASRPLVDGEKPRGLSVPGYTITKFTPGLHQTDSASNVNIDHGSSMLMNGTPSGMQNMVNLGPRDLETLPAKPQSAHSNKPVKIASAEKDINENSRQEMLGLQTSSAVYHASNTTIKRFESIRNSADPGKVNASCVQPERSQPLDSVGEKFWRQAGVEDLNEQQMQEVLASIQLMNSLQNQVNNATPLVTDPLAPSRSSMPTSSMKAGPAPIHISRITQKNNGQLQVYSELSDMLPKDNRGVRNGQGYITGSSGLPMLTNEGEQPLQGQAGHERFSTQGQEELVQQYQLPTVYSGDGRHLHAKFGVQKRTSTSYTGARSTKFSREAADSHNQTAGQAGAQRYWQSGQNFVAIPQQQKSAANFRTSGLAKRLPPTGARKGSQVTGPAFGSSQYAAQSRSVNAGARLLPSQSFHRTSGASMLMAAGGPGIVAVRPGKNERRVELQQKREVISTAYTITRAKGGIGVLPRLGQIDRDISPRSPNESRQLTEVGGESRTPVGGHGNFNKVMSHPNINAEQSQYHMEAKNLDNFQQSNNRMAPARSTVELTKADMHVPETNENFVDVKQPSVEKPHTSGMASRMTADHACPRFMKGANMPKRHVTTSQGRSGVRIIEDEAQVVRYAHGFSAEGQRQEKNKTKTSEAVASGGARRTLDRNASDVNVSGVNMLKLFSNSHVGDVPAKGGTSQTRTKTVELGPNQGTVGDSVAHLEVAGRPEPSTLKKKPVSQATEGFELQRPEGAVTGAAPIEDVDDKIPNISRDLLRRLNIEDLADDLDSSSDDESCDSADDYEDHEPLIIQLMESMFTRKKTVQESEQMINHINVDQIKEEIRAMRLKERVLVSELERQKQFEDRMEGCERLNRLISDNETHFDYEARERAMLKKNPLFLALKAQQIERNRFKRILQLALAAASDDEDTGAIESYVGKEDKLLSLEGPYPAPEEQQHDANDIFKHTFVNVEPGQAQHYQKMHNNQGITVGETDVIRAPGVGEPTTERQDYEDASSSSKGYQLALPPIAQPRPTAPAQSDCYFFDHFSFDLPPEYYSSQLGDFKGATRAQQKKLRDFLLYKFPSLNGRKLSFKVAYDSKNDLFNVLLLGKDCPLSRCCKMTVCFQFSKDIGGKVICLESLCAYNPLQHFFIDLDLMQSLFGDNVRGTQQSLGDSVQLTETAPVNNDTQQSQDAAPVMSKSKFKQLKPIFKRLISREISKLISKGRHGTASIRKIIETQANLEDHAYDLVEQKEVFDRAMREMQSKLKLMRRALREPVRKPRGRLTQEDIYQLLYEDSQAGDDAAVAAERTDPGTTEGGLTTEQRTQMKTRHSNYDLVEQQVYQRQDSIPGIFSDALNYQGQGSNRD